MWGLIIGIRWYSIVSVPLIVDVDSLDRMQTLIRKLPEVDATCPSSIGFFAQG